MKDSQFQSKTAASSSDAEPKPTYYRAVSAEDRNEIYRLRYDSYLLEGAIEENPTGTFTDKRDRDGNAMIFGIALGTRLAASIRLHLTFPENPVSPGLEVFPDILQPMLDRGESFVDPTRFVVDRYQRSGSNSIPLATVRIAAMAAEHFGVDHMLATVRAEHVPFYKRYCHMELRSQLRTYPGLKKPICLMSGPCETIQETVFAKYPFFASTAVERMSLFGPPVLAANTGTPRDERTIRKLAR